MQRGLTWKVESGEGIERAPGRAPRGRSRGVESGEGIESNEGRASDADNSAAWNPVKELKVFNPQNPIESTFSGIR